MYLVIKDFIKPCYCYLKLQLFNYKWRKQNRHNSTKACNLFPINCVHIGNYTYGDLYIHYYRTEKEKLLIGNFCSIGPYVSFYLGGEHDYKNVSTFPIKHNILHEKWEAVSKGKIIIEDDVWIGGNSIILSGIKIGQGAIIGAGSVVSKDVPAYAIYCGNRIIKYRFNSEICSKLKKFDFGLLTKEDIKNNIDALYNVDEFLNTDLYKRYLRK